MAGDKDKAAPIYDSVIIGAGPAGLTAAIYTSRARLRTIVIESPSLISQASYADLIENYPGFPEGISGLKLTGKFKQQAEKFGAEFVLGPCNAILPAENNKAGIWQVKTDAGAYLSSSVIIASGSKARRLEVKGEDRFLGKGVSYCATCDGLFFKDKEVAVVGGGDAAVQEALFLTKFAGKVMLIHRRDRLRAAKIMQEKALSNKRIEIIWNSEVAEILGDEKIKGVRLKDVKTGRERVLACEGVFVFIGFTPNTDFIKGLVNLDKDGYIVTNEKMESSTKGIFACGDCRNTALKQIVTACGYGALAAVSCRQYVEGLNE